jgi:hypothetical protein
MNQPSTDSSLSSRNGTPADAISRRAYEIWEREGRPEGCDLRHWLQAEQELGVDRSQSQATSAAARTETSAPRNGNGNADTRALPSSRPAAAAPSRDTKRPPTASFTSEKNVGTNVTAQNAAKRKPTSAPVL